MTVAAPLFEAIEVEASTIRYVFSPALRSTGLVGHGMRLDYGDSAGDLRAAPRHVVVIPGLLNLAPVVWYSGRRFSVDIRDDLLAESLMAIRQRFQRMYEREPWDGEVVFAGAQDPPPGTGAASATLFSGGVDSIASVVQQITAGERPILITVGGADLASDDIESWRSVVQGVAAFAGQLGLQPTHVVGDFKECLNSVRLSNIPSLVPYGISFWAGAQHGLALTGLTAPLAWSHGVSRLVLSSSFTSEFEIPWGSGPEIDGRLRWTGLKVEHSGFEQSRQSKMARIVDFFVARGAYRPQLRVCVSPYGDRSRNCGACEKCLRTMAGLLAVGADPLEWGFDAGPAAALQRIRDSFESRVVLMKDDEEFMWNDIRRHALSSAGAHPELVNWLEGFEPSSYRDASKGRERFQARAKAALSRLPWVYGLVKRIVLRRKYRAPR